MIQYLTSFFEPLFHEIMNFGFQERFQVTRKWIISHLPLAKADAVTAFNLRFCFFRHFHTSTRKKTKSITRMMIMAIIIYRTSCLLSSSAAIGLTLPCNKNICICKLVVLFHVSRVALTYFEPIYPFT